MNVIVFDFVGFYEVFYLVLNVKVVLVSYKRGLYSVEFGMIFFLVIVIFDEVEDVV